jgi:aminoglycoside phosphotransferase (APT) family kinase protein
MGEAGRVSPDVPTTAQIQEFLEERHRASVSGLDALAGGFWSSALAYRVGERELVLRLGSLRDGFEMDRLAMGFDRPGLPVPRVLDVGVAFGRAFAISERCHGQFLERVDPAQVAAAGPALERTLAALRAVPSAVGAPAVWYPPDGVGPAST